MTPLDLALIAIIVTQAAYIARLLWLRRRQHGSMFGLDPSDRLLRELLTTFESNVTQVIGGLHQDIESLRREMRAAVKLPPETEIPRIAEELHTLRVGAALVVVTLIALIAVVGMLAVERADTLLGLVP